MKNKIYLINYWFSIKNNGANLTAFALQNLLHNFCYKSYLIDNTPKHILKPKNKFNSKKIFQKKYLQKTKHIIKNLEGFNNFSKIFITGSDQVFRPIYTYTKLGQFLLDFVKPDAKKIAFSASFGVDKEQFLKENTPDVIEHMKFSLSSFDFISVREKSGVQICKDLFGLDAEWIIDPVFILDKSKYDDLMKDATKDFSGKIVSYVLDTNDDYKKAYKNLSEKYNKKVVEIANSNISVENWLSAIKNCEFLITDSFHGMCFAIIFNKPFICVANKQRGKTRFDSICEMLNIENQCIDNISEIYDKDCIFKYDKELINKRINEEKEKGLKFLEKALNAPIQITEAKKEVRLRYLEERVSELEEQNNFRYQLKLKCIEIFELLPKCLQEFIYQTWLKIKGFINAHRK